MGRYYLVKEVPIQGGRATSRLYWTGTEWTAERELRWTTSSRTVAAHNREELSTEEEPVRLVSS